VETELTTEARSLLSQLDRAITECHRIYHQIDGIEGMNPDLKRDAKGSVAKTEASLLAQKRRVRLGEW
jgi:hypothetical protein